MQHHDRRRRRAAPAHAVDARRRRLAPGRDADRDRPRPAHAPARRPEGLVGDPRAGRRLRPRHLHDDVRVGRLRRLSRARRGLRHLPRDDQRPPAAARGPARDDARRRPVPDQGHEHDQGRGRDDAQQPPARRATSRSSNNTRQNYGLVGPARLVPYGEAAVYAQTETPGGVGGTVPATLSLTLGAPASFGAFTPGVDRTYEATTTATVTSTAGDATLTTDRGTLTNGAFTLRGAAPGRVQPAAAGPARSPTTPVDDRVQAARSAPPSRCAPGATARRSRSPCRRRPHSLEAAWTSAGRTTSSSPTCRTRGPCSRRARGGVSSGPYDVAEPRHADRRRAGERRPRTGAGWASTSAIPWPRFCYGRQVHGATVRRATEPPCAERPYTEEDGQATALDRRRRDRLRRRLPAGPARRRRAPSPRCTAAGARSPAGIVAEGVEALREVGGTGPITAAIGPGARGCCYEVGEEVHAHFAAYDARRGERNLDLAAVARAAARGARHRRSTTSGSARSATSASSRHRRDNGITGRQAGVICRA